VTDSSPQHSSFDYLKHGTLSMQERYPSDCTDDLRVSDIFVVVNSEHVYVVARMFSEGSCGQGGIKVAEISTVQV